MESTGYPRLIVDRKKLTRNARLLIGKLGKKNIDLNVVTKAISSDSKLLDILYSSGVKTFSDSRYQTGKKIRKYVERNHLEDVKICLLRPPSDPLYEEAVQTFDRFYISTVEAAMKISKFAKKLKRNIELVLMLESGDFREGFLRGEIIECSKVIRDLPSVRVIGAGTNVACLGGNPPTPEIINRTVEITKQIIGESGYSSPGNSSALYLLRNNRLPNFNGELRIGEALYLGSDTITHQKLPGLSDEVFKLKAEVIEVRKKTCDKIHIVVSLGIADIGQGQISPDLDYLEEFSRSSDHTVFKTKKIFKKDITVGDILEFKLTYFPLVMSFLSPFVYREVR